MWPALCSWDFSGIRVINEKATNLVLFLDMKLPKEQKQIMSQKHLTKQGCIYTHTQKKRPEFNELWHHMAVFTLYINFSY